MYVQRDDLGWRDLVWLGLALVCRGLAWLAWLGFGWMGLVERAWLGLAWLNLSR